MLDPHELGTILGVWAHPDDEAYVSGGLMATAVDDGRRVVCVTATKGEGGFPDGDPRTVDERRQVRAAECAASLRVLGVREHHWLDYPDGGSHLVDPAEPVAKLTAMINEIQPDTILSFGPDGITGHSDHVAVSRWTTLAYRAARQPSRLLYATNTADWNERVSRHIALETIMMVEGMQPPATDDDELAIRFRPTGSVLDRKIEALRAQASQTDSLHEMVGDAAFRDLSAEEYFRAPRTDDWP